MKQFLLIAALLLPSTLMAQTSNDAQAQIEALTAKVTALEKKLSDTRNQLATARQRQEDIGRGERLGSTGPLRAAGRNRPRGAAGRLTQSGGRP